MFGSDNVNPFVMYSFNIFFSEKSTHLFRDKISSSLCDEIFSFSPFYISAIKMHFTRIYMGKADVSGDSVRCSWCPGIVRWDSHDHNINNACTAPHSCCPHFLCLPLKHINMKDSIILPFYIYRYIWDTRFIHWPICKKRHGLPRSKKIKGIVPSYKHYTGPLHKADFIA